MTPRSEQNGYQGRYQGETVAGPGGSFRVLQSMTGMYFIADNVKAKPVRSAGQIVYYSLEDAETTARVLAGLRTELSSTVQAAVAKATKVPAPSKPTGDKKPTAASRFRELILAAKLSDDDIFKAVQKEFGLADNRRSYVDWYRKDLKKKGEL